MKPAAGEPCTDCALLKSSVIDVTPVVPIVNCPAMKTVVFSSDIVYQYVLTGS